VYKDLIVELSDFLHKEWNLGEERIKEKFSEEQNFVQSSDKKFSMKKLCLIQFNQPLFIVKDYRKLGWLLDLNLNRKSVKKHHEIKTYTSVQQSETDYIVD